MLFAAFAASASPRSLHGLRSMSDYHEQPRREQLPDAEALATNSLGRQGGICQMENIGARARHLCAGATHGARARRCRTRPRQPPGARALAAPAQQLHFFIRPREPHRARAAAPRASCPARCGTRTPAHKHDHTSRIGSSRDGSRNGSRTQTGSHDIWRHTSRAARDSFARTQLAPVSYTHLRAHET